MVDVTMIMVHRMFIVSINNNTCYTSSTACFSLFRKLAAMFKNGLITG